MPMPGVFQADSPVCSFTPTTITLCPGPPWYDVLEHAITAPYVTTAVYAVCAAVLILTIHRHVTVMQMAAAEVVGLIIGGSLKYTGAVPPDVARMVNLIMMPVIVVITVVIVVRERRARKNSEPAHD